MFTPVTTTTYREAMARTEQGILLCHKKLCPHCMNMEKVVDKFSSRRPGLALLALDSEEEPEAMAALGLERVPTLVVIKKGAIAASRTGLMNPRELETLFDKS